MPVSTSAGISSGVWPSSRTVGILAMAMSYAIAHIGINVLDLDRSVKFYEDVFGMKEVFRMHPKSALDMVIAEASTPAVDGETMHQAFLSGAHDCLIKPVDDNELLLRITALQRRTQTGGERCRNLSFLSSTTLDPKRASAAVRIDCRACHVRAGHGTMKSSIIPEGRAPVCRGRNGP